MKGDATRTPPHLPATLLDPLTGIARDANRRKPLAALKAEAARLDAQRNLEGQSGGRQRVVLRRVRKRA